MDATLAQPQETPAGNKSKRHGAADGAVQRPPAALYTA